MNPNLEKIVKEDHELKTFQQEKEKKYYSTKMEEFGLSPIKRFIDYCPSPSPLMTQGITYGYKDLGGVAEAIAEKKPWAVVSGLNPSGPLHFGHKAIFDELLWMQKNGAEIYIPVTNDESYVVGKTKSIAESRKIAYEEVIPSIIAFGFNPEKTHIYVDSDYPDIYNVAMDISTKLTLNKAFGVFGFDKTEKGENPGTMFYRSAVQLAQILLPQYPEFGGPKPTLIPVGIDQHPYILLARDVAGKKGFIPPSEIVTKFLWGFDGKGKMAASRPNSAIFLTDSFDRVKKILKSSYTGGSPLANFQRKVGGIPEICPIYSLRATHFEKKADLGERCRSGKILCGEDKKEAIKEVQEFLEEHKKKREEAIKEIPKFLLNKKIESILNG